VANTISVGLYANASNSPGTLIGVIGTMPDSSLTTTPTSYSFNPSTTYPLTPNTRYWIGITVSGTTSQAAVEFQTNNTGIGIANEFIAFSLTPPNTDSNADYEAPFMGEVNVTPATPGVPVPPAIMLSMIGIACLGMYFGWRRMAGRAAV
jgi:hypothetical protein